MPEQLPLRSEIGRLHERLDDVLDKITDVDRKVTGILSVCGPCQDRVHSLETARHLIQEDVAVLKSGRTDTLSIKSVGALIGVIGALIGTIIGGVAMLLGKSPPVVP